MNTVARPQQTELETLIAGSDNSPAALREILNKLSTSRVFVVTNKPWDGRSVPRADMQLLLVSDGPDQEQVMLALFSSAEHTRGVTGGDHAFKTVVEVDAAWAFLGVPEGAGILINPNAADAPAFRIGSAVAAELKKYAEHRLRAFKDRGAAPVVSGDRPDKPFVSEVRTLIASEDLASARSVVEGVLAATPNDHDALLLAGEIAIDQFRDQDAVGYFSTATKVAPHRSAAAASFSGLGQALTGLHQYDAAENALRQAYQLDPGVTGPLRALADVKASRGEIVEAIELLRRLTALLPQDAGLYLKIADMLVDCGQLDESLALYDIAIELKPTDPLAYFNKGVALQALGRDEDAVACYRKAHEVGPNQTGYYRLISLRTFTSDDDQDVLALKRQAAATDERGLQGRIDAQFSLGKVYDDLGEYAQAFEHLSIGNQLKRSKVDFSLEQQRLQVAKIIALFTPGFMERFRKAQKSTRRPIFIVGMPRSGTTLLEQMLAAHPEIYGAGELSIMQTIALEVGARWGRRDDRFPGTDAELNADFAGAAARYDRLTERFPLGNKRLTDKMPQNFMFLGLMDLMFDDYTVINCRRHPVATGFSCYQHAFNKNNMPFSYDLAEIAGYYKLYAGLMEHWHKLLPGKILDVNYEDMVKDPEKQLRRVLAHCDLEYDAACLEFHTLQRPVQTASSSQVRKPLYGSAVEKWKHYEPYLQPLIGGLGDLAKGWPKTK